MDPWRNYQFLGKRFFLFAVGVWILEKRFARQNEGGSENEREIGVAKFQTVSS